MDKKFIVETENWSSRFYSLKLATEQYTSTKESMLEEGVQLGDWIELREKDTSIKRAVIVEDKEQLKSFGLPNNQGMEFEWWAKWEEVTA